MGPQEYKKQWRPSLSGAGPERGLSACSLMFSYLTLQPVFLLAACSARGPPAWHTVSFPVEVLLLHLLSVQDWDPTPVSLSHTHTPLPPLFRPSFPSFLPSITQFSLCLLSSFYVSRVREFSFFLEALKNESSQNPAMVPLGWNCGQGR